MMPLDLFWALVIIGLTGWAGYCLWRAWGN